MAESLGQRIAVIASWALEVTAGAAANRKVHFHSVGQILGDWGIRQDCELKHRIIIVIIAFFFRMGTCVGALYTSCLS